jgi:hypothetical protein
MTLSRVTKKVAAGSAVKLSGRLSYTPLSGKSVGVARKRLTVQRLVGGTWLRVRSAITSSKGNYAAIVHPRRTTTYRLYWAGVASSPRRVVRVR